MGSSLDDVRAAYPTGTLGETLGSEASRIVVQATDVAQGERYLVFELFEDVAQTIFVQTNPELVHEFCG